MLGTKAMPIRIAFIRTPNIAAVDLMNKPNNASNPNIALIAGYVRIAPQILLDATFPIFRAQL